MKRSILILSNAADPETGFVASHLDAMGETYYRFDTERFPAQIRIDLKLLDGWISGALKEKDQQRSGITLRDIKSVWYRRPLNPEPEESLPDGYAEFAAKESSGALWSLYTTLEAYWVNPSLFAVKLLQQNKLYQMRDARRVGLRVPDTIITNDPEQLLGFCRSHAGIIAVKTLRSGFFCTEENAVPLWIFTTPVSEKQLLEYKDDIGYAPVFAQEYIQKQLEFRVTIVGQRIFACAIHSQDSEFTKHDWRNYDFEKVKHEEWKLPEAVEGRLLRLMHEWHLTYGAFDLILTPEGEYVFLEVNPSGQWYWIEKLTGMPITKTIAELLAHPLLA